MKYCGLLLICCVCFALFCFFVSILRSFICLFGEKMECHIERGMLCWWYFRFYYLYLMKFIDCFACLCVGCVFFVFVFVKDLCKDIEMFCFVMLWVVCGVFFCFFVFLMKWNEMNKCVVGLVLWLLLFVLVALAVDSPRNALFVCFYSCRFVFLANLYILYKFRACDLTTWFEFVTITAWIIC